jgi:hypothetical protein
MANLSFKALLCSQNELSQHQHNGRKCLNPHHPSIMNSIEIYAELLTNIRTVTLVASLRSESNQETKADLSADGQTITIYHEGHSVSIRLPTQMSGGGTAALTLPATPSKNLTLRLQLEEKAPGLLKFGNNPENVVPWPASAMSDAIQCFQCATPLLKSGHVKEWRDLPSENWAEMMDFWHCHKPHEHNHDHGEVATSKGYSSSSKLQAISGVGYVGLSYFFFLEDDCCNVEVGTHFSIFAFSTYPFSYPACTTGVKKKIPACLRLL